MFMLIFWYCYDFIISPPIFMESVGIAHGFAVVVVLLKQGDSFRHLSSKTETSWKIERWMIHTILVFSLLLLR
jgi:hypothetical protein